MAKCVNYRPCLTPGFQATQALPHWPWVPWGAPSGPILALFLFLIPRGKQTTGPGQNRFMRTKQHVWCQTPALPDPRLPSG